MKNLARIVAIGAAVSTVAVLGASPAAAATYNVSAKHNGVTKATAYWDNSLDQLCVKLVAGHSGTAIINGNSVTDYSADGDRKCIWVNNTSSGTYYALKVRWYGNGGAFESNQSVVLG